MPFLFNQVAIFELKAHKKMQIPNFKGTFHLELDLFSSLWLSCAALIVMPHSNPQCAPLASLFLDYCSLWSAFCVLFEMDQILTWGAESCVRWILFVSQRNLLCSIPTYLGQNLAEFPPFPRQTREKEPKTQQSMEQLKTIRFIIIINCHWECQLCIVASVLMLFVKKLYAEMVSQRKNSSFETRDSGVKYLTSAHQKYSQTWVRTQWTKWLGNDDWFSKGKLHTLSTFGEWWGGGRALDGAENPNNPICCRTQCFLECFPNTPAHFSFYFCFLSGALSMDTSTIWYIIKKRNVFLPDNAEKRLQTEPALVSEINVVHPALLWIGLDEFLFPPDLEVLNTMWLVSAAALSSRSLTENSPDLHA